MSQIIWTVCEKCGYRWNYSIPYKIWTREEWERIKDPCPRCTSEGEKMKRKIKLFKSYSLFDLENQINYWLEENPNIRILGGEISEYNSFSWFAAIWWCTR